MPGELQALRDRIEVLEFELAEALRSDAVAPLQLRYDLHRQQAALLAYMLDGRVKTYEGCAIAIGLSEGWSKNHINSLKSKLRRKLPWLRIIPVHSAGQYLAPETIARIKTDCEL